MKISLSKSSSGGNTGLYVAKTSKKSESSQVEIGHFTLIHHQNATCGVAFSPSPLRRMPNTPQALGLLRLASGILLVARKWTYLL